MCLHSPILSASDLNRVMIVQKQEQQIVFAVDQTWDKSLSFWHCKPLTLESELMIPGFQGFDVGSCVRSYFEGADDSSVKVVFWQLHSALHQDIINDDQ